MDLVEWETRQMKTAFVNLKDWQGTKENNYI